MFVYLSLLTLLILYSRRH